MRIGILQTGHVSEPLRGRHGDYPAMFERMLQACDPGVQCPHWAVVDGELPDTPDLCDAWLITGSRHGVYDDLAWIAPLKDFLRAARDAERALVGVCFGHQVLAEAFGGRAEKSEKGWGVGVHRYEVVARPPWMAEAPRELAWHAMHQDQVTAIPADATLLARSTFCPYAMLAYGDPARPDAISVQGHPEFSTAYARDLVLRKRGESIPEPVSRAALESLGTPVHTEAFARWTLAYLALSGRAGVEGQERPGAETKRVSKSVP